MIRLHQSQKGFTILELIIASTVFSIMLVLATSGIIYIGKAYYKGITVNRTQETTRAVIDDVTRNYQQTTNPTVRTKTVGSATAYCVGLVRYTFLQNTRQTDAVQNVLWTDRILPTAPDCEPVNMSNPQSGPYSDNSSLGQASRRELLSRNMRIQQFNVSTNSGGIAVAVRVIYGEDDVFTGNPPVCLPISQGGQFCAVSSLSTFVKKR